VLVSSAPVPPRSALLACWATAWLSGEVGLPEVVARATAYDESHVVAGLWVDDLELEQALGRLRAEGAQRVRLVLPAPGDPLGLPGPSPFTHAALDAGEGVLVLRDESTGYGLVPTLHSHGSALDGTVTTVTWQAYDVADLRPNQGPFLHEAEHDLRLGVMEAARALTELDVARWDPDVAEALDDLRRAQRRGITDDELPGSWPARARDVLVRTRALATLVHLADLSTGGAVDAREAADRAAVLRELARVVRRARVAAYNAHEEPR
jgi:hypothetical protein